jgi:RNA polymerase sigma-70 factor (ECF subfamily)
MQERQAAPELLLPRVARGEPAAVEACLQRYAPLVWTLARRLARDTAALEEVVQEIFIDVWRSASRFDPALASEATYIATIARRRIIDRQRRAARAPEHELLEEGSLASEPEPGFAAVEARDEARRAALALERIRPEQRRLILMAVVDGLTHEEIATTTGLPLGTVKSHIRRGLDRTAQILRAAREGGAP